MGDRISEARNEASAIWSEFNGRTSDGWILRVQLRAL